MGRGFGITAAVPHDVARELATEAERLGYSSFWANDMPNADGLATIAAAASVTTTIGLGVGVIPLDRRPPASIAADVAALGLPVERLLLGIGGGGSQDALARVRSGAVALGAMVDATIIVGALGPKMCELAGEVADGVLLNWMTAEYAGRAAVRPLAMSYVRCGFLPDAEPRLRQELERYDGLAYFARHEERMGVTAFDSSVLREAPEQIESALADYERVLDETIVRAITKDDELTTILPLLRACAPAEYS